jgi:hypothetical protein
LRIYAQTPPPRLCRRSSLISLYPSMFTSADVTLVLSHVSEMVMMSNFAERTSSRSWIRWTLFRSERMFRWITFIIRPVLTDILSVSIGWSAQVKLWFSGLFGVIKIILFKFLVFGWTTWLGTNSLRLDVCNDAMSVKQLEGWLYEGVLFWLGDMQIWWPCCARVYCFDLEGKHCVLSLSFHCDNHEMSSGFRGKQGNYKEKFLYQGRSQTWKRGGAMRPG